MPEELTPAQLIELTADLKRLTVSLKEAKTASELHARPVELDQTAVGRLSRIDAIQHQQMADAAVRRAELRLKQLAVALDALADDDYGWCRKCQEPIGYARLKARPESPCCVPCMREIEAR